MLNKHLSEYLFDGIAYSIDTLNPANNAPLFRFYNRENGTHFYTASVAEKNMVQEELEDTYSYDGPAYDVSLVPVAGGTTVYRFLNRANGSHFYTASVDEKNSVQANNSDTYLLEGAAFYLAP